MLVVTIMIFLVAWISSPVPVLIQEHEVFLKYLPAGGYTALSFEHQEAIKQTNLYRDYPEFFADRISNPTILFADVEVIRSYRVTMFNVRRIRKELDEVGGSGKEGVTAPGLDEKAWIYQIPGLRLLTAQAQKTRQVADTGEKAQDFPIYSFYHNGTKESEQLFLCVPEPDIMLISGSKSLLESMVLAGQGLQPGFYDTYEYTTVLDLIGDNIECTIQLFNTIRQSNIEAERRSGAPESQLEYMEQVASRNPQMSVRYMIYEADQFIYRTEYIFEDDEAAENFYDTGRPSTRMATGNASVVNAEERESETPPEVQNLFSMTESRMVNRRLLEKNRVLINAVFERDYIEEWIRVHRKHKEYFDKAAKERQESLSGKAGDKGKQE